MQAHLARRRIEAQALVLEHRLAAPGMAPQHGADARVQLVELEGLDQVVVGTGVEPRDAVAVLRGVGQTEVEQHEIEALGGERRVRRRRVIDPVDRVPLLAQRQTQAVADHPVVFDEQQSHGAS